MADKPLFDFDLGSDGDQDGDGNLNGLLGTFGIAGVGIDGTVGGGDTDGDDEHGSLIDLDANADSSGEVGSGMAGSPFGGDLLGGDLIGGGILGGDLLGGELLGGDLLGGGLLGDDPLGGGLPIDSLLGVAEPVFGIVEPVLETVGSLVATVEGVADGLLDTAGLGMLGDIGIGETIAQLGSGDLGLLDMGLAEDLADLGAITDVVGTVLDTATSAVDGLLGGTDLLSVLDVGGLLGDG
jgi:hypothetical protein